MTNRERVLQAVVDHPGSTDTELVRLTGVRPHQQVNQICRRLAAEGRIERRHGLGGIVNVPTETGTDGPLTRSRASIARAPSGRISRRSNLPAGRDWPTGLEIDPSNALVVIPCSGRKRPGGVDERGRSVCDVLPPALTSGLQEARSAMAARANVDERALRPAIERYAGTAYHRSDGWWPGLRKRAAGMVIVSGGYGIVLADERIGTYDGAFKLKDWPAGLLEQCLLALSRELDASCVVAMCARTSGYAELIRATPWRDTGVSVAPLTPLVTQAGGAQVFVPRAIGDALEVLADGPLSASFRSSDGVALTAEVLA